jgi:hypothetical protein
MNKKALIITITITVIAGLALFAARRTLAMYANQPTEIAVVEVEEIQAQAEAVSGQAAASALEAPQAAQTGQEHADEVFADAPAGDLSDAEKEALRFMREEEKLAHEVYVTLSSQWASSLTGEDVFARISQSELAHMNAVAGLLERYGLEDPASSELGVFTNPDLQALYNKLVAQGSQSLADALKVGAAIEEIDILDLQTRLAQTSNAEIQQVFSNLARASGNHLRSFAAVLNSQTGEIYQPQYLSQETYAAIVNSGLGGGYGNGQGGRGQGGGQDGYGMRRGSGGAGQGSRP